MSAVIYASVNSFIRQGCRRDWLFVTMLCLVPAPVLGQSTAARRSAAQDEKEKSVGSSAPASSARRSDPPAEGRKSHARLRPFYDVSLHSAPDGAAANLAHYLVDQNFWSRRPTIVVVTPISPNVLQPDEGHAEYLTEALLRQIAADLGVRDVQDQVSQTIGFLRKLGKKTKRSDSDAAGGAREAVEQASAEQVTKDEATEPAGTATAQADSRGLRTVQLILLPDARPIWNGMSLFDRSTVVERSLSEYLKKVPVKRERLLERLEPDQFRFAAFPGKEAGSQMMDSLDLERPELQFLVVDRHGEVGATWNKFNFDAKQISAAYRRFLKE